MNDEPITLSEIAAGGVSALNRLRLLIDRTQRAATPMNDAWVSLTAEIERALVDQSLDQDTLMRDVQTALSLLAKRTEECEALRAQLSEAQARLALHEDIVAALKDAHAYMPLGAERDADLVLMRAAMFIERQQATIDDLCETIELNLICDLGPARLADIRAALDRAKAKTPNAEVTGGPLAARPVD